MKKTLKNKFEIRLNTQLVKAKVKFQYETERIPYLIAGHYIPDFIVETPTGKIYIEAKGYLRPEVKRKMVAVKKLNPHLDIRFVFYSEREAYTRWATKCGFRYAIETIPTEWLEGL